MQQRAMESRNRLITAARELFAEKGFYNTNTKEISKKANVSIGNFYNFFDSKYAIYFLLVQEYTAFVYSNVDATLQKMLTMDVEHCKSEIEAYIFRSYQILLDLRLFFHDMEMITKDNTEYMVYLDAESEKLRTLLENFLLQNPILSLKLSPQTTAHILYMMLNEGVLHMRWISEDAMIKEYLHGLAVVVQDLIFS